MFTSVRVAKIDEGLGPRSGPGRPSVYIDALHGIGPDKLQGLLRQDDPSHGAAPTGAGSRGRKVFANRCLGEPSQRLLSRAHLGLAVVFVSALVVVVVALGIVPVMVLGTVVATVVCEAALGIVPVVREAALGIGVRTAGSVRSALNFG